MSDWLVFRNLFLVGEDCPGNDACVVMRADFCLGRDSKPWLQIAFYESKRMGGEKWFEPSHLGPVGVVGVAS